MRLLSLHLGDNKALVKSNSDSGHLKFFGLGGPCMDPLNRDTRDIIGVRYYELLFIPAFYSHTE